MAASWQFVVATDSQLLRHRRLGLPITDQPGRPRNRAFRSIGYRYSPTSAVQRGGPVRGTLLQHRWVLAAERRPRGHSASRPFDGGLRRLEGHFDEDTEARKAIISGATLVAKASDSTAMIVFYGVDMEAMGAFLATPEFAERTAHLVSGHTVYAISEIAPPA